MNKDGMLGCVGFFSIVIGIIFGCFLGACIATHVIKQEVIAKGLAEYRVNPKNGDVTFHYLVPVEKE